MNRYWLKYLLLLFLAQNTLGQVDADSISADNSVSTSSFKAKSKKPLFDLSRPTIGIGSGLFSYYGDILGNNVQFPFTSRIGYELFINYRLTRSFLFDFYVLFGKLGANERLGIRNENFLSEIRLGGLRFHYDFSNLLNEKAILKPFVFTGIESFEFLSKTDLFDKNSNSYFYWSDGSIRNLPEGSAGAYAAQVIKRDYIYESDIRELNKDNFGKYLERSFAIPIGVGFSMEIGNRTRLKFTSTMHLTATDYIDGISDKSIGDRKGRKGNDNFMYNSVSLHYDLALDKQAQDAKDPFISEDELFVLDNADADGDGVIDEQDSCHGTPKGVKVDIKGCPLDDDKDYVYNFKDRELDSKLGAPVDSIGVTISDSAFQIWYEKYADTNDIKFKLVDLDTATQRSRMVLAGFKPRKKAYTVQINNYKNGIPTGELTKLLGIPDLKTFNNPNDTSVSVTVGNFNTPEEAKAAEEKLRKEGFKEAKAGSSKDGDGRFDKELTAAELAEAIKKQDKLADNKNNKKNVKDTKSYTDTNLVVYRVQLGAYKKQLSTGFFKNTGNVVAVVTEDGLYKYLSGSYPTLVDAASYRADMVLEGYTDAFIAAYKAGRRIPLRAAGAIPSQDTAMQIKEELNEGVNTGSALDKAQITFKIQLGIFKNEALGDATMSAKGIQNAQKSTTVGGLVRFTSGNFSSYQEAVTYKNEMATKGFTDAFVVAFFKNEVIPLTEALELLKQ